MKISTITRVQRSSSQARSPTMGHHIDIVDKINNDLRVVVNEQAPSLRARGMEPAVTSPAEFRSFIRSEIEKGATLRSARVSSSDAESPVIT